MTSPARARACRLTTPSASPAPRPIPGRTTRPTPAASTSRTASAPPRSPGTGAASRSTSTTGTARSHGLALYALDWDRQGRVEQFQVINAATGAVLDTETLSSFGGGEYVQWNVSGDVEIKVTRLAGPNAVVAGLFLDPPPTPANRRERRQISSFGLSYLPALLPIYLTRPAYHRFEIYQLCNI